MNDVDRIIELLSFINFAELNTSQRTRLVAVLLPLRHHVDLDEESRFVIEELLEQMVGK
jgi:hypothetical protein